MVEKVHTADVSGIKIELDQALSTLDLALLEFLSREMAVRLEKGETVHPASVEARNSLVLKLRGPHLAP